MRHGTVSSYVHGRCKCSACKKAWADYQSDWRRRKFFANYSDKPQDKLSELKSALEKFGKQIEETRQLIDKLPSYEPQPVDVTDMSMTEYEQYRKNFAFSSAQGL